MSNFEKKKSAIFFCIRNECFFVKIAPKLHFVSKFGLVLAFCQNHHFHKITQPFDFGSQYLFANDLIFCHIAFNIAQSVLRYMTVSKLQLYLTILIIHPKLILGFIRA